MTLALCNALARFSRSSAQFNSHFSYLIQNILYAAVWHLKRFVWEKSRVIEFVANSDPIVYQIICLIAYIESNLANRLSFLSPEFAIWLCITGQVSEGLESVAIWSRVWQALTSLLWYRYLGQRFDYRWHQNNNWLLYVSNSGQLLIIFHG